MKAFLSEYGITIVVATVIMGLIGTATFFKNTGGNSLKAMTNNFLQEAQLADAGSEDIVISDDVHDEEISGNTYTGRIFNSTIHGGNFNGAKLNNCTMEGGTYNNCEISGDNSHGTSAGSYSGCIFSGGIYEFNPASNGNSIKSGYKAVTSQNQGKTLYRIVVNQSPVNNDDELNG